MPLRRARARKTERAPGLVQVRPSGADVGVARPVPPISASSNAASSSSSGSGSGSRASRWSSAAGWPSASRERAGGALVAPMQAMTRASRTTDGPASPAPRLSRRARRVFDRGERFPELHRRSSPRRRHSSTRMPRRAPDGRGLGLPASDHTTGIPAAAGAQVAYERVAHLNLLSLRRRHGGRGAARTAPAGVGLGASGRARPEQDQPESLMFLVENDARPGLSSLNGEYEKK